MRRIFVLYVVLLFALPGCVDHFDRTSLSVKVLYPRGGRDQHGFNRLVSNGVAFAQWFFRLSLEEFEPTNSDDADRLVNEVFDRDLRNTLVVTTGFAYQKGLDERQCKFGGANVLHLDSSASSCPRLRTVRFRTFEPSFQAGVAAIEKLRFVNARRQQNGKSILPLRAGAFGAFDTPNVREFLDGFAAGIAYAGGELLPVNFLSADAAGFEDVRAARNTSRELFRQASVIFPVAGNASRGAVEVADELLHETKRPHFVITVDVDWSPLAPKVALGAVLKRVDRVVREAVFAHADGAFAGGDFHLGVDEGFTEMFLSLLHEEIIEGAKTRTEALGVTLAVMQASSAARDAAAEYYRERSVVD